MSRRATLEIVEAHDVPASPLAEWMADEDARLDARADEQSEARALFEQVGAAAEDVDAFLVEGVLKPLAAFGKGLLKPKPKRDPDVRWPNEVAALRAWWQVRDTSRRSPTARLAVHCETGGTFTAASRPAEPRMDDGVIHVARALAKVSAEALAWTVSACLELRPPRARTEGGELRNSRGNGFGGESVGSAQAIAATARETGDNTETWQRLVAEAHGIEQDEATLERIDAAVKGAKRALRAALRAVELDTRPRWLIPPATRREIERDAAPEVVTTCLGAPVVDGLRGECGEGEALAADVAASPRCERCGNPWGQR